MVGSGRLPPAPQHNPHVGEAETLIRTVKAHEIRGRLEAIAEEICLGPPDERDRLVAMFRTRQEELGLRPKDVKSNMDSLAQRLTSL